MSVLDGDVNCIHVRKMPVSEKDMMSIAIFNGINR